MRRGEVRRRGQREGGGLRGGASCGCGGQVVDGRRFGFVTGPAQSPNYKVQSNHDFTIWVRETLEIQRQRHGEL